MISDLAAVARALGGSGGLIDGAEIGDAHRAIAEQLKSAAKATVLLGNLRLPSRLPLIQGTGKRHCREERCRSRISTGSGKQRGYQVERRHARHRW